jgi:hypothetical protein
MTNGPQYVSRPLLCRAALLGLLMLGVTHRGTLAAESYSEDSVRAAYLFRFAGYVGWPDTMPADAPFSIDVLGAPSVAKQLRLILPTHTIKGHSAQVREISGLRDLGKAQVLYVGAGHAPLLRELRVRSPTALLVVSAEDDGLDDGSVINFITVDHNVRFEVSLPAAERCGLKISADLLGVAVRVLGGHAP